ncbi:hypothetical protein, partial [Pectobacterium carotovorum]|uniref:hypothetical protein n=1 Tax=Pectobacterium carotovorum TaxID=554 RepID=UPI00382F016A
MALNNLYQITALSFIRGLFFAANTESDILQYTLSQYTQRPLYEVPSVTGSGGSPPPETPG